MDFSERLRKIRGETPQAEIATKIGVHKNTIGRWERGEQTPDQRQLCAILDLYSDIDPAWLLTGEGPMMRGEKAGGARLEMPDLPFDAELYMQVVQAVLEVVETYDRPPRAATLMELIRLLHDEIKEGELESEEVKKNVVRILKFAS